MYGWTVGYFLQCPTVSWLGRLVKTNHPHNHSGWKHEVCTQTHPWLFSSLHPLQKLPVSQACPLILVYGLSLSYRNGTVVWFNMSTAGPRGQLMCDETQCRFSTSIKDALSVSVSAYNAHGASVQSSLFMPVPGIGSLDCKVLKFTNEKYWFKLQVIVKVMVIVYVEKNSATLFMYLYSNFQFHHLYNCSCTSSPKYLSSAQVMRKVRKFWTSWWIQRTSLCPGYDPLSSWATRGNM